jgi:hypothetical protein
MVDASRPFATKSRVRVRVPAEALFLFDRHDASDSRRSQAHGAASETCHSSSTRTETL